MSDKDELLKEHKKSRQQMRNLGIKSLFWAYFCLFLVLFLSLPKIYIANEIYYTSRDINELKSMLNVLLEENKELKTKLEQIRYKNQIINDMNY